MIDAAKRLLIIETKKGGISSLSLSALIEDFLRKNKNFTDLDLSFNPIADREFIAAINEFNRIRSATISIARPNFDWTDRHSELTNVAKESEAKALDVTARAPRGKSLSKERGLVDFIKSSATSAKTMFQKIRIVGSTDGDAGLTTLDLSKHVKQRDVLMDTDPDTNLPKETEVRANLSSFLNNAKAEDGEG